MRGVDPRGHGVMGEMERVKKYFDKIKDAEDPTKSTSFFPFFPFSPLLFILFHATFPVLLMFVFCDTDVLHR